MYNAIYYQKKVTYTWKYIAIYPKINDIIEIYIILFRELFIFLQLIKAFHDNILWYHSQYKSLLTNGRHSIENIDRYKNV